MKNYYVVDRCRMCNNKNLTLAVKVGTSPVADKYLKSPKDKSKILKASLDLYFCKSCKHLQLNDVINPDYLWSGYTFQSNTFNKKLVNHFKKTSLKLKRKYRNLKKNDFILDIGSNDGSLLKAFKDVGFKNILGIDAAKNIVRDANKKGIKTFYGYFNGKNAKKILTKKGHPKIITSFNAFAHSDNIIEITKSIKKILDKNGIFIFEASYLLDVVKKLLLGTIFHEHLDYHSVEVLNKFFNIHNLKLFKVERNEGQGGSIVGYVQHYDGPYKNDKSVIKMINMEKKMELNNLRTFKKFETRLQKSKVKITNMFKSIKKRGYSISAFGSSISSTTYLSYYNIGKYINFIVDDNKLKQRKFTPKDLIKIYPSDHLKKNLTDYIIIFAWVHTDRIIKNLKQEGYKRTKFITLYPEIKII